MARTLVGESGWLLPAPVSPTWAIARVPLSNHDASLETYELILGVLLRVFTHTDESNAQLGTLLDAALALMAKVLQPLGTALTTLPVGSSYPGRTTGFAFEMHYVLGNMTPHREPAWALLAERARLLAHRCSQVAAEPSHRADLPAVTAEAAAHAHAIADALTAQVPAELRPEPGQATRL